MKEAPEALARIAGREIEYIQEAMPALERVIEMEKADVLRRVEDLVRQNGLTPDLALQLWHQFRAPDAFLRRLGSRIKLARVQLTQASQAATMQSTDGRP